MKAQELQDIILRNTADISEVRQQLSAIQSKEQRVRQAIEQLRQRLKRCLDRFDPDRCEATDERLTISALANEILIFASLGYDIGMAGFDFLLGVAAFLEGRNMAALDYFEQFLRTGDPGDRNYPNAAYLAGMATYNRREFHRAIDFFKTVSERTPDKNRAWRSMTYVGELSHFVRKPAQEIERLFRNVEDILTREEGHSQHSIPRATLYLKLGNCYVGTFRPRKEPNEMVDNQLAIQYYKQARKFCPRDAPAETKLTGRADHSHGTGHRKPRAWTPPGSLLPAVIDYSLAQALLLANSVDMEIEKTPSQLFADVFRRLRRIVLAKREEIILAQCYLMLGTCACYSSDLSKDIGEIYLEYARHQTLVVPPDVCFYSCITKELLNRDEFVQQIDFYASELESQAGRR
ncbi:MAG: hypothetical protein HQ582_12045 [Planctomycetes bacterium]|nr:hypothetical protein [Planctomycetota bacterium]